MRKGTHALDPTTFPARPGRCKSISHLSCWPALVLETSGLLASDSPASSKPASTLSQINGTASEEDRASSRIGKFETGDAWAGNNPRPECGSIGAVTAGHGQRGATRGSSKSHWSPKRKTTRPDQLSEVGTAWGCGLELAGSAL